MSRTKRSIQNWTGKSCNCDEIREVVNYPHMSFLHNNRNDGRCEFCCRDRWMNGYDNKPSSILYALYIKQPGWRDHYNGPDSRRHYKKMARRYRRREQIEMEW